MAAAAFSVLIVTAPPPGLAGEASGYQVKVDGREALLRSVELFLNRQNVKQVQVAFDQASADEAKRKFGNHLGFSGVRLAWSTGRWIDQVAAGAEKLAEDATHVVVHDAARPCVPYGDIDALMAAAERAEAVALSAPVKAGLVELDEGGSPVGSHPPGRFAQLLTPQAYGRARFLEMAKAKQEPHPSHLTLVPGSALNVRVGSSGDAGLAKAMLNMLPKPKPKAPSSPFEEAQW